MNKSEIFKCKIGLRFEGPLYLAWAKWVSDKNDSSGRYAIDWPDPEKTKGDAAEWGFIHTNLTPEEALVGLATKLAHHFTDPQSKEREK